MAATEPRITLKDHLQRHEVDYDKKLDRHEKVLFGEDGDDGLTRAFAVMKEGYDDIKKDVATVKNLEWVIIGSLILVALTTFFK